LGWISHLLTCALEKWARKHTTKAGGGVKVAHRIGYKVVVGCWLEEDE